MAAITAIEKEGLALRSITSWKRITISAGLAVILAYISGALSGAHFAWFAFSVIMGIGAAIAILFAFLSITITLYYEMRAQYDYGSSLLYKSALPFDQFVARDILH